MPPRKFHAQSSGGDGSARVGPWRGVVVGIGASAGALEALERLFARMPADGGLAFVVVQHLDRHHQSMLPELLARFTKMPVREAVNGTSVEPNHVYVIQPNAVLAIERGLLHVDSAAETGLRLPVDTFLRSLAEGHGENAIGIVLSGTGADGTVGLRSIKEQGGLTIVQAPETAKYEGMPQSAIAAGLADLVLAVEDIPARLLEYQGQRAGVHHDEAQALDAEIAASLGPICDLLRRRTGHDFGRYKQGTLVRRVRRRVVVRHSPSAAEYLRFLESDATEPELLLKDLLIGVTQFFRDPDAFQIVAGQVVPNLFVGKPDDAPVRIWVPGCASGEEAYSLAMLVREHLARVGENRVAQIFATDIDTELLARARLGIYPEEASSQVSPERLERFFVRQGDSFQVVGELREMCIFSEHSLIKDPPFSSLDLVSCRNVLIYLDAGLQERLVPLFHYALRPGGYLFLGPSEGLAAHPQLFSTVDKRYRIFRRNETASRPKLEFPLAGRSAAKLMPPGAVHVAAAPGPQPMMGQAVERVILDEYAPACVVIDERGQILYTAGPVGFYLQAPAGAPRHDIFEMAPGTLGIELRTALIRSGKTGNKVTRRDVPVEVSGRACRLRMSVRPLPGAAPEAHLFLVVLQEVAPPEDLEEVEEELSPDAPVVERLSTELRTTRTDLQAAMEELASANEDLRSSNEELVSTNEELQSANEELQTSKEEMQSINEELESVNSELHQKVQELATANTEVQNLYASSQIATVFLDPLLRIARFTPAAKSLLRLIDADLGRPLADLAARFQGEHLLADAENALRTGAGVERQVQTAEGTTFLKRVLPYRTLDNAIAAVSVTFVDVTALKKAQDARRESEEFNRRIIESSKDCIKVLDLNGNLLSMSSGGQRLLEIRDLAPFLNKSWIDFWKGEHHDAAARAVAQARAGETGQFQGFSPTAGGTPKWWDVLVTPILGADDKPERLLAVSRDVTERRNAEEALRESEERLRMAQEAAHVGSFEWDVRTNVNTWTPQLEALYGLPKGGFAGTQSAWEELVHPEDRAAAVTSVEQAFQSGEPVEGEWRVVWRDGSVHWLAGRFQVLKDAAGNPLRLIGVNLDITERRNAEAALRESEERLRTMANAMPQLAWRANADGYIHWYNDRWYQFTGTTPEQMEGWGWQSVHDPDALPKVLERWKASIATGERFEMEFPLRGADGRFRRFLTRVHPLKDAQGQVVQWFGTNTDVTELVEAHAERERLFAEVRDAQAQARSDLDAMTRLQKLGSLFLREENLEPVLREIVDAAISISGADFGNIQILDRESGDLRIVAHRGFPPDWLEFWTTVSKGHGVCGTALERRERVVVEDVEKSPIFVGTPALEVQLKAGVRAVQSTPLVSRSGAPLGMFSTHYQKPGRPDERALRLLDLLARQAADIVERSQGEHALRAANGQLVEADRRKNEFLAMLSHELRNPLAPIRNSVYILERAAAGGEQAVRAQRVIERQTEHMSRLVEDLLDVTRISRGKIQLQRETIDLADVVRRAVEDHRSAFTANGLELGLEVPDGVVRIDGDRTRIAQVIGNLLHNASKFTSSGGKVVVSVGIDGNGQRVVVRVRDTGAGIAAGMLGRLFEPFTQADSSLDRSKGGLGLGLALVKAIVEMHGGAVGASSEGLGRGAEFTVSLPLLTVSVPKSEKPRGRDHDGAPRRILVIEDNRDSTDSLREALELGGHLVEVAYSGPEGIESVRSFKPDFVLCDIGLPGMDGYAVARSIRSARPNGPIRLVALSGYAQPEDVAKAKEAGFDCHLAKPPSLEAIAQVLAEREQGDARGSQLDNLAPPSGVQ